MYITFCLWIEVVVCLGFIEGAFDFEDWGRLSVRPRSYNAKSYYDSWHITPIGVTFNIFRTPRNIVHVTSGPIARRGCQSRARLANVAAHRARIHPGRRTRPRIATLASRFMHSTTLFLMDSFSKFFTANQCPETIYRLYVYTEKYSFIPLAHDQSLCLFLLASQLSNLFLLYPPESDIRFQFAYWLFLSISSVPKVKLL